MPQPANPAAPSNPAFPGSLTFAAPGYADSQVSVSAGTSLGVIPATGRGLNAPAYNGFILTPDAVALITSLRPGVLRYPAGAASDYYDWRTNAAVPGVTLNPILPPNPSYPPNTFDAWAHNLLLPSGAAGLLVVNYGSFWNGSSVVGGSPSLAADWIRYANKGGAGYNGVVPTYNPSPLYGIPSGQPNPQGNQYGIGYAAIANEQYTAASGIEVCYYATDGATYGTNAAAFISAIKAVDPSVKCLINLFPDALTTSAWNSQVLAHCGTAVDIVELHYYPMTAGSETDAALLASPDAIAQIMRQVRAEIAAHYTGNPASVAIWITELGSVFSNPGPQTTSIVQAVYLADAHMTFLEQGATGLTPWGSHTTINANGRIDPSIYNPLYKLGDLGWLASGTSATRTVADAHQGETYREPAPNTPFPAYYGALMLTWLWSPGDTMVQASASGGTVRVHAVKGQDGRLRVLLVNRDTKAADIAVTLSGYVPAATWDVYTYSNDEFLAGTGISHATQPGAGTAWTQHVPAYSLTTLVM